MILGHELVSNILTLYVMMDCLSNMYNTILLFVNIPNIVIENNMVDLIKIIAV